MNYWNVYTVYGDVVSPHVFLIQHRCTVFKLVILRFAFKEDELLVCETENRRLSACQSIGTVHPTDEHFYFYFNEHREIYMEKACNH